MSILIPDTYEGWKHCITEICRIPLTLPFVEERLAAIRNPSDFETGKSIASWGEAHRQRVIAGFEMAQQELQHKPI